MCTNVQSVDKVLWTENKVYNAGRKYKHTAGTISLTSFAVGWQICFATGWEYNSPFHRAGTCWGGNLPSAPVLYFNGGLSLSVWNPDGLCRGGPMPRLEKTECKKLELGVLIHHSYQRAKTGSILAGNGFPIRFRKKPKPWIWKMLCWNNRNLRACFLWNRRHRLSRDGGTILTLGVAITFGLIVAANLQH